MSEVLESLSSWLSDRPKWLKVAATRLLKKSRLSEEDIAELVLLCQQEAEGKLSDTSCSFPTSAFSQGETGSLRLCAISDVEGVNALAPKKPLDFGKGNITVVYGSNGSGKSGYVRLLKHVCGARELGALHGDVFKPNPGKRSAKVTFMQDSTTKEHAWDGINSCEALKNVDIFDTSFGRIFTNSPNEACYEPPVLSFFSSLIDICEKVATALDTELGKHVSKKPAMPERLKTTQSGIWYDRITEQITIKEIGNNCAFDSNNEAEVKELQQRLAEQSPADKAKKIRTNCEYIDSLIVDTNKLTKQLSAENLRTIVAAKQKVDRMKRVAEAAANKVFSDNTLDGVGTDIWQELWGAARKYSVSMAYKDQEYPHVLDDSRCVLCQQPLSKEAKDRLLSFESHIKGEAQRAVTEAEKEYSEIIQGIDLIPTAESLKARIDAAGIVDEDISTQVFSFFSTLRDRRDIALIIESEETIPTAPLTVSWIADAEALSNTKIESAKKFEGDAKKDKRDELQIKLYELLAKQWLKENHRAIIEDVVMLKNKSLITKAKRTTNTADLSKKKSSLAKELLTKAFVERFSSELQNLRASHVKVELVHAGTPKGHVLHKIQLRGAVQNSLSDVLSEGESRIVSIAAFLADVTGKGNRTPFIFDDPISSLDQSYEEAVVQRLCTLSTQRQVVVFTHRLSLLVMIQSYAKKIEVRPDVVCIRQEPWGTGEPGELPIPLAPPGKALNALIQNITRAKKVYNENGTQEYEHHANGICRDFRIILERIIELVLLADVVQRYRIDITTKGKIAKLSKINEADCTCLDELMTKYSKYAHSQPDESPVALPLPNELEDDCMKLKEWLDEFVARPTVKAQ